MEDEVIAYLSTMLCEKIAVGALSVSDRKRVGWRSPRTSLIKMAGSMESSLIKHVICTVSSLIKEF